MATSVEEVDKEHTEYFPPAVFLRSELDKITSTADNTTIEEELARVNGRTVTHQALKRYEFRNALVYPNGISIKGGNFLRGGPVPHRTLLSEKAIHVDRALYCLDYCSTRYFGHWLMEACCTAQLKRDDEQLLLPARTDWPHTKSYIDIFGFTPSPEHILKVDQLFWFRDHMQGPSRQRRYAQLRSKLRQKIESSAKGKRYYLRRGTFGTNEHRTFENEDEIIKLLSAKGYELLDLDKLSLHELLEKGMDAEVIVTVEGSHQSHAALMLRQGGLLMVIQPPDRFNNIYRGRTHAIGLEYGFTVLEKQKENGASRLDPNALFRTLDLYIP